MSYDISFKKKQNDDIEAEGLTVRDNYALILLGLSTSKGLQGQDLADRAIAVELQLQIEGA